MDTAFAKFVGNGKIHVLISNAAILGPREPVEDTDEDRFLEAIQQNLKRSLFVAQAFLRYAVPDAVVIDVSSSAAHINFTSIFASYNIAKLAVFRLWDSLAFAKPDLNVFHAQPGVIATAMNKEVGGTEAVGYADDSKRNEMFSGT